MMTTHCDLCGNDQDGTFEVRTARQSYFFDTFECAIQFLAPTCAQCGCKVIGHGIHAGTAFYCCAHCARESEAVVPSHAAATVAATPVPND